MDVAALDTELKNLKTKERHAVIAAISAMKSFVALCPIGTVRMIFCP